MVSGHVQQLVQKLERLLAVHYNLVTATGWLAHQVQHDPVADLDPTDPNYDFRQTQLLSALAARVADAYRAELIVEDDDSTPLNAVDWASWFPCGERGPVITLAEAGLFSGPLLADLFRTNLLSLAVQNPHADCAHSYEPDRHQHVELHFNAGHAYTHDGCVVTTACVGCHGEFLAAILSSAGGTVRAYRADDDHVLPDDTDATYQLVDPRAALDVVRMAREFLIS